MTRIPPITFRLAARGIPGRFVIDRGTVRDYQELAQFHYCCGAPATWAGVWTIRYFPRDRTIRWAHLRPHPALLSGATEGPRVFGLRKLPRTVGRAAKRVFHATCAIRAMDSRAKGGISHERGR